jgi:hypothetical protein
MDHISSIIEEKSTKIAAPCPRNPVLPGGNPCENDEKSLRTMREKFLTFRKWANILLVS